MPNRYASLALSGSPVISICIAFPPVETLRRADAIGRAEGLKYVYEGNVFAEGEETACPGCGKTILARLGFSVRENRLRDGRCPDCGTPVAGVWK